MSKSKQKNPTVGVMVNMCQTLDLVATALKDHERRLGLLEGPQLKDELEELKNRINLISDKEKRLQGLNSLNGLCDLFGITNLENTNN